MSYSKSAAQSAKGSVFSIGVTTTSGGTTTTAYTQVGEVTSSSLSGNTARTQDVTNFNSGTYSEFIPVLIDSGSIKLVGNRVSTDSGQVLIASTFASLAVCPFKLVLPLAAGQTTTGDSYTFNALIQSQDFTFDVDKAVTFDVTLKVSGPITLTTGS